MTNQVTRPALRYHGGKFRLAPWIISFFPPHRVYVEPFGGGASVLLRKERSYAEVYNDLDHEVVNFFRVVRDHGEELRRKLELTPFSREEFLEAWYPSDDSIEQARRTVIRSFMGFGSAAVTLTRAPRSKSRGGLALTGFRANSNRSGTTPAHDWNNYPESLSTIIIRLQGVVIENRDAASVIAQHDSPSTLFYIDPPYVSSTRDAGSDYMYELTDADHENLARVLHQSDGMVVMSGYPCDLYDRLYSTWERHDCKAFADGARERTECVWLNPACAAARRNVQKTLWGAVR